MRSEYHDLIATGIVGRGGGSRGGFPEDTASSSSAALSLQLPFSDDEAALLSGIVGGGSGRVFHLGANVGAGGAGGGAGEVNSLGLAVPRTGWLEGLPVGATRTRMLELNQELTHLDRCRGALEGDLRQERAR